MKENKNFSALGKIDEKYIEEVEAYSALSEGKESGNKGGRYEATNKKRRNRRTVLGGISAAAAAVLICLIGCIAANGFSSKRGASLETDWTANASQTETADSNAFVPKDSFNCGEETSKPESGGASQGDCACGSGSDSDSSTAAESDSTGN